MSQNFPASPVASREETNLLELPQNLQDALEEQGILPDEVQLHARADLDERSLWGERHLVVTPQRLRVLRRVNEPENTKQADGNGRRPEDEPLELATETDLPLDNLIAVESRPLVGATAIEVRIRTPQHSEYSANGATANGTASTSGTATTNGVSTNGVSADGIASDGSLSTQGERVLELIRSSNAYARELAGAARKLEKMRVGKVEEYDADEEEKDKRKLCPSCGRPLPVDTDVCPFCVNKWQAMRRLLGYLGPYKWMAIGNGVLSVVSTALSFVPVLLTQPLVDRVFMAQGQHAGNTMAEKQRLLVWLVLGMLGASALSSLAAAARGRMVAVLGAHVLHDIRAQVFGHLQRLSLAYFDKREIGAVMSRVQNDVQMLQNFLLDAAENMLLSTLTIIIVVMIMLSKSPLLTLAILIPVPIVVIITNRYWRGLMKLWRRVWQQGSALGARLADSLGGVRVVRAFAQEEHEVSVFQRKSGEVRDATVNVEARAAMFYPIMGFIMGLGAPIMWYIGGRQVLSNTLTFGELSVFGMLIWRLYEPVQQLTRQVNFTTRAMTAAERVFEVLDTEPEVRQSDNAVPMPRVQGSVEFHDVIFGYDKHRPVLHNVNLKVEPGEMIGLVGHSGAGKSTLINLLMRFYDVDEGAILIDGVDVRKIDRDDVRRQIGVVLQEPYLFHGSIWENIAYGKHDATPGEIMEAAKAAFAHNFIVNFPDGYDTLVGERGTRLSGGERQRISIARAILHDPRILILDEATASVDTQTELEIQKALQNLVKGRTTFAIAHRLSTLRNANRLIVLEGGKIAEMGTHDELMEKRGTFYKLVTAQKAIHEVNIIGG